MSTKATGIFLWQKIQVILARQEKTEESTEQNNKVFQDTELFLCKQGEKLLFHSQHICQRRHFVSITFQQEATQPLYQELKVSFLSASHMG